MQVSCRQLGPPPTPPNPITTSPKPHLPWETATAP
ncbi:hypothetical protein A6R68_07324 [Neotoma lepida]|uniref:Uncharacterized protein n=1 Tax=Neotoma lepida TaxID=56216 RepID=A0A1A6GFR2_NEOLE|nr:hypothetical protein A6R68_07324 [Neotoma lepida]